MNTLTSKTNEPHNFVFKLSHLLDLRSSNKHAVLQNLSIYYLWKNIEKQYKNNKLKIKALTWNDNLNCRMVLILCQIFKIILNIYYKAQNININFSYLYLHQ